VQQLTHLGSLGMLRLAQVCTATSSGRLVIAQFFSPVCSGSKAEMEFGGGGIKRPVMRVLPPFSAAFAL
jgi:hypothetical protein